MATERKNPYDLTDWFEGFKSALDYMEEHPEIKEVINQPERIGNPYQVGGRVISAEEWIEKQRKKYAEA